MIKCGSMLFAPMESITDATYRGVIESLYPEAWGSLYCDFLRVPAVGTYPLKHLRRHIGEEVLSQESLKQKTAFQILTAPSALTQTLVEQVQSMELPWLDLNLGCPSKTVNKRAGGAALLGFPEELKIILKTIRGHYKGFFSVKMRLGLSDSRSFIETIKMIEGLGIDAITIHARTRDQLYKGTADWSHIAQAVKAVSIPVVGNGDIWSMEDAKRMLETTGCHAVMVGRGAMKKPWMAAGEAKGADEILWQIKRYFGALYLAYQQQGLNSHQILKQFKKLSRYIFDDLPEATSIKRRVLLSQRLEDNAHLFMNA